MRVAEADAERALVAAFEVLGTGCAERPAGDGTVEMDFWVPASGPGPETVRGGLAARGVAATVAAEPEDDEWTDAIRRFHRPVRIGRRLLVRPPWCAPETGLLDVEVDPGMAFGTGQHATTRTCLEMLLDLPAGPLLDAGCGSGVIAIAARRLGHDPVWAVDSDPLAVDATITNARVNGVGLRVGRRIIGRDRLPAAPLVVANLTAEVLLILAEALRDGPPEHLIASGLREHEAPGVEEALRPLGLRPVARGGGDGWVTLRFAA